MTLHGKVISIESGTEFTDKVPRATIRVEEAGSAFHSKLSVPNTDGWEVDQAVLLGVSIAGKAVSA